LSDLIEIIHSIKDYIKNDSSYGTRDKWIRGFGWDQALLGGEMPTAVCIPYVININIVIGMHKMSPTRAAGNGRIGMLSKKKD